MTKKNNIKHPLNPYRHLAKVENFIDLKRIMTQLLDCDLRNAVLGDPKVPSKWKRLIVNLKLSDFIMTSDSKGFEKRFKYLWPE